MSEIQVAGTSASGLNRTQINRIEALVKGEKFH